MKSTTTRLSAEEMSNIHQLLWNALESRNWQQASKFLILLSNDPTMCLCDMNDDILDAFETFLFGIEQNFDDHADNKVEQEEQHLLNELILCFLSFLSMPLDKHEISRRILYTKECNLTRTREEELLSKTNLLHNLCIEHKYHAIQLLLRNLDPDVASRVAIRSVYLQIDFEESDACGCSVYHDASFYHSPMQAAWEGFLFDNSTTAMDNLTEIEGWDALWKTTVYLLLAFDRQPLDLNHAFSGKWNMIHAIARYGHAAPSAVMWYALHLHSTQDKQSDIKDHALHVAISSSQICYKSYRYALDQAKACIKESSCNQCQRSVHAKYDANRVNDYSTTIYTNPMSMLLEKDSHAATRKDYQGRLPLHLFIMNQRYNSNEFDVIRKNFESNLLFSRGYDYDPISVTKILIDANPYALEFPEPSSGLYPFMLAASNNTATLDTVFLLLSENPGILEVASSSSFTKKDTSVNFTKTTRLEKNPQTHVTTAHPSSPVRVLHQVKRVVSPEMWSCEKKRRVC